ncbi:ATP-binding protein [Hamadaea sp. NPDC051192]|uniref:ATP-binding protein n=1 Tax=Hamadaea sp. NPDC051192 TaxID=3154940 RepID=UPI00343149DB
MNAHELRALQQLRFEWAPMQEDVWTGPDVHVAGLNRQAADGILAAFARAKLSPAANPLGIVLEGRPGVGKTHLLSSIRRQVQAEGGYFFLLGVPQGDFWDCLIQAFIDGLARPTVGHPNQLAKLLDGLCDQALVSSDVRDQILGRRPLTRDDLDDFIRKFRYAHPDLGRRCHQTLRALILRNAWDNDLQDLGEGHLRCSVEDTDAEERTRWRLPSKPKPPRDVVEEISLLVALSGPTVFALDQVDATMAQVRRASVQNHVDGDEGEPAEVTQLLEDVGQGLMEAREKLRRTVLLVSCLHTTWDLICKNTLGSIADRFHREPRLSRIPSAELGSELVTKHFKRKFEVVGFQPPHPTWPVLPSAFASAPDYTPRQLLQRIDAHVRECVRLGRVIPLADFEQALKRSTGPIAVDAARVDFQRLTYFDQQFATHRKHASVERALEADLEDREMPQLLGAGLQAWIREKSESEQRRFTVAVDGGANTATHATLRESFDEEAEDFGVWSFRGLAKKHHAAVLPRLARLTLSAALDPQVPQRRAVLLRNVPWPNGPVCRKRRERFETDGGMLTKIAEDDLKTFHALGKMLEEDEPGFDQWLADRRPASRTGIFTEIFGSPPDSGIGLPRSPEQPGPSDDSASATGPESAPDAYPVEPARRATSDVPVTVDDDAAIAIGSAVDGGQQVAVNLRDLRKHVAIFAGSGSGKTVLIRRLIEECALQGVSTIALDPNNDLARLGDPWPRPPEGWAPDDEERARRYLDTTDVVVWTPRREAGRPLSLQPLPDFGAIIDDPDEFGLALDSAVSALAPRARMGGNTAKMDRGRAVLREALAHFAKTGGNRLDGLVDILSDLPDGVTTLGKARELAYEMAQTLTAAKINDPLFGGSGVSLDPAALLTPAKGKRARISLISLIGLPSDEQRQSFVNQLQMALFSWIKRNPANDRPLGGLFVMDEAQIFAPAGAVTACTESSLALASQARKYGLGLIFATQAPRGLHNRIVGNAATHFYGFLNSPVQISAAKELAQAKGGRVSDVGLLRTGHFYAMGEGVPCQQVSVPMCLSHHPSGPLTSEEVLERAKAAPKP